MSIYIYIIHQTLNICYQRTVCDKDFNYYDTKILEIIIVSLFICNNIIDSIFEQFFCSNISFDVYQTQLVYYTIII